MEKATFEFVGYKFSQVHINFEDSASNNLSIEVAPRGCYSEKSGEFRLTFELKAFDGEGRHERLNIVCNSVFRFSDNIHFDAIPSYFFPNSIAIVFPYVRAFISSLSVQAGLNPIILPTYNLSSLQTTLKNNTKVVDAEENTISNG